MNKKKILNQYTMVMLILFIISLTVMIFTPLLVATAEFEIAGMSFKGIDYISPSEEKAHYMEGMSNSSFIGILASVKLVLPIVFGIVIKKAYSSKPKKYTANQMLAFMIINFAISVLYFLLCLADVTEYGDGYGETQTFIPMLIHGISLGGFVFLKIHCEKALNSEVEPLFALFGKKVSPARDQLAQVELLVKYKDLLDSGIITDEQFEAKKQELLEEKQDTEAAREFDQPDNVVNFPRVKMKVYRTLNKDEPSNKNEISTNFKMKWYKFIAKVWMPIVGGYFGVVTLLMGVMIFVEKPSGSTFSFALSTLFVFGAIAVLWLGGVISLRKYKKIGVVFVYISCFTPSIFMFHIMSVVDIGSDDIVTMCILMSLVMSLLTFAVNAMYFQKRLSLFEKLGKTKKQR